VLLWENKDGGKKLVAWTAPSAGGLPDELQEHRITVEGVAGKAPVVTLNDTASVVSGDPWSVGLTGAPVFITLPQGANPVATKTVPGSLNAATGPAAKN